MIPTMISMATSDDPPDDTKGSAFPPRKAPDDHCYVEKRLERNHDGATAGNHGAEVVGGRSRYAHARVQQQQEQRHHHERAHQAQLLANDGEDEVGVGLGKVQVLLMGVAQALPEQAAARQGVSEWISWYPVSKPPCPSFHGFRNTMRRSRRYDDPKMPIKPSATTTPTTMSMVRSGTSPSHMTARMPTTQIMAVPRSDCGPKIMSTGATTSKPTGTKTRLWCTAPRGSP